MANRYRVKAGNHRDQHGNVYKAGDVVTSNDDLAKMFPNKFKVLTGPKPTRGQTLIEEQELDVDRRRLPRAATVGTKLESKESKEDDGDDSDRLDPMQGEDSDISDSVVEDSDEESEGTERRSPKKSHSASKEGGVKKKKKSH